MKKADKYAYLHYFGFFMANEIDENIYIPIIQCYEKN